MSELKPTGTKQLAIAGLAGFSLALLAVGVALGVMALRLLHNIGELVPSGRNDVLGAAAAILTPAVAFHLGLGTAIGVGAEWALEWSSARIRLFLVMAGCWTILVLEAVAAAPSTLTRFSALQEVPYGVILALGALLAAGLLCGARPHPGRAATLATLLVLPALLPRPDIGGPRVARTDRPGVILLGIDNLRRTAVRDLADSLLADPGRYGGGIRHVEHAVSPVAVTRFAWQSILTGRPAAELISDDTLSPEGWRRRYRTEPFVLTRSAARLAPTAYLTDDAFTNVFQPGESFDVVQDDARGWRVEVLRRVRRSLPLWDLWVGRHVGIGVGNTPVNGTSARLFNAVAREAASGRYSLVAAHAVTMHGDIEPTLEESGGLLGLARLRPRDLATHRLLERAPDGVDVSTVALPQALLHERRLVNTLADLREFVASLENSGLRRRNLVVLFSDHGDYFPPNVRENYPDLHGTELEPSSSHVGVIVLLPTEEGGALPSTHVQGTLALNELGLMAAEFLDGRRGQGTGVLARLWRGDDLGTRVIPARSFGRPNTVPGAPGRSSFAWEEVRSGMRFWPDGRVSTDPRALDRMTRTADFGATDGRRLAACSRLDGREDVVLTVYDGDAVRERHLLGAESGLKAEVQCESAVLAAFETERAATIVATAADR